MKVLKIILMVIVAVVALFLIVAIFLPSEVSVQRSAVVEAPDSVVFDYITDFTMRANWDPWLEMDSTTQITLSEKPTGVGAGYAWEGPITGSGKMVIDEVVKNKLIKSSITFFEPQTGEGKIEWRLEPVENGTNLTWVFFTNMSYPVERYFGLLMDGMMGPQLEKGIENIDFELANMLIMQASDSTETEVE